jgi:hypothetical protein
MSVELLDRAGGRRSPATLPGFRCGCLPRNKARIYPADPPGVEEIIAVVRSAGNSAHGARVRALIVILWRAGLRINEALTLAETDLEPGRGSILVRHGKAASAAKSEWTIGHGSRSNDGASIVCGCRSDRSSAHSTEPPAGDRGHRPVREQSCGDWRLAQA